MGNSKWGTVNKNTLYCLFLSLIFALGVFLRFKGFWANPSFWHDECALAWNVKFKSYGELFDKLRFLQIAPPFFLVATKFLTSLFGYSEKIFRLIPFACGCLSLGVFYLIAKELFKTKKTILFSLFLFAINLELINYSFEFKQYGVDVFFVLLLILFFIKLNLTNTSYKKLVLYSLLISIFMWSSIVTAFVIASGFFNLILKRENYKKIAVLFLPILINSLIYLIFYVLGNYQGSSAGMVNYWSNQFVLPNFSNFLYLIIENLKYFFSPVKSTMFILILMVGGILFFYKERQKDFLILFSLIFIFLILASVFHIYPFSTRLVMFLIPMVILLFSKVLDAVDFSKKTVSALILFLMMFIVFPQVNSTIEYLGKTVSREEFPREITEILAKKVKPNDIIFVSDLSNTEFAYYSSLYNIKNQVIQEPNNTNSNIILDSIKKKQYCWFYFIFRTQPAKLEWISKHTKVIDVIRFPFNNYLIYAYIK